MDALTGILLRIILIRTCFTWRGHALSPARQKQPTCPAERRTVELFFAGRTTDKQQAAAEDVSTAAIGKRFAAIAWKLRMPYRAQRDQAMLELINRGWIDIVRQVAAALMLGLSLFIGLGLQEQNAIRAIRARPPTTRPVRGGRNARQREPMDFTDMILADWRLR